MQSQTNAQYSDNGNGNMESIEQLYRGFKSILGGIDLTNPALNPIIRDAITNFINGDYEKSFNFAGKITRNDNDSDLARLIIAMSKLENNRYSNTNIEDIELILNRIKRNPASGLINSAIITETANKLKLMININLDQVMPHVEAALADKDGAREKIKDIITFTDNNQIIFDPNVDAYTQYKILQALNESSRITDVAYVQQLQGIANREGNAKTLNKKIDRQILLHDPTTVGTYERAAHHMR